MAYGVKYRGQFNDLNGVAWKIDISQDAYAGGITAVQLGANPLRIDWQGQGDDQYKPVKGSEAYIELISTTALMYKEFAFATTRDYKVQVYRLSSVWWTGWIDPEYFKEPFMCAKYTTTLHAVDGLGDLKEIAYPGPVAKNTQYRTFIEYIYQALAETDIELDLLAGLNFSFNDSAAATVSTRVLEYLYVDYRTYREDADTYTDCYTVLEDICTAFRATLFQRSGKWMMLNRDAGTVENNISVNRYNSAGVFQDTFSYDYIEDLTEKLASNNLILINTPPYVTVRPPLKSYTITHDQGELPSIMRMYNLEGMFYDDEFATASNLANWTENDGVSIEQGDNDTLWIKGVELNTAGAAPLWYNPESGAGLVGYVEHQCYMIEGADRCSRFITSWADADQDEKRITAKFNITHKISAKDAQVVWGGTIDSDKLWMQIVMREKTGPATYNYYYSGKHTDTGAYFMSSTTTNKIDLTSYFDKYTTDEFEIKAPIGSTSSEEITFFIRLFEYTTNTTQMWSNNPDTDDGGSHWKDVRLYFNYKEDDYEYSRVFDEDVNEKHRITDDFNIKFTSTDYAWYTSVVGGALDVTTDGRQFMFKNVVVDQYDEPVKTVGTSGLIMGNWFEAVHRLMLTTTFRNPKFIVSGKLLDEKGAVTGLNTILKDYGDRYFMPLSMSFNVKQRIWDGQWVQMDEVDILGDFGTSSFDDSFFIGG